MSTFLRILYESFVQAFQQLTANRLRSFLSLFGISIGIFCIIGIAAAIDSLEFNIRKSFDRLGDDIVFVSKFDWGKDPGPNFFKYLRRPNVGYGDYEAIKEQSQLAAMISYVVFVGNKTAKYRSNSVDGVFVRAVTQNFADMYDIEFAKGRFFSLTEANYGMPKVVLGHKVAETLFGAVDPIGKTTKIGGHKLEVIGVIKEMGEGLSSIFSFDNEIIVSYEMAKKMANLKTKSPFGNSSIDVKTLAGISNAQLKDELTGILRGSRKLRPMEENNFSLNEMSIFTKLLDTFFGMLTKVGIAIGIFAIFVGAFGIANIMFVSVKERTGIIGVKKALGAKQFVILTEFLIEAILLCMFGGLVGLGLVYLGVGIMEHYVDFDFRLSKANIIWGLSWSVGIGVIAGFIPALNASRLDPVVAMRA